MGRKIVLILISVLSVALAATICVVLYVTVKQMKPQANPQLQSQPSLQNPEPETQETQDAMSILEKLEEAAKEETKPVPETQPVTEPETEPVTEPEAEPEQFILTFAGDCTLGSNPSKFNSSTSFVKIVGDDYDYPFANVRTFFENDDFTFVNLESVLADSGTAANKTFTFRGPEEYVNILSGSSVEAVTLANNHTMDFGNAGYESTKSVLEGAQVSYVECDDIRLFTTESGLTIGLYADAFNISEKKITENIEKLKDAGAEVIICAFHWGEEGRYHPQEKQKTLARHAISQGAHIVAGHHPHVLQETEFSDNGVIFYSLGNFCFGGNVKPKDKDSAIVQVEIIRETDGTIRVGVTNMIPVCISSVSNLNNYQPTPYLPDSEEYARVMEKLYGTFTGKDLVVDYGDKKEPSEPTTPAESSPPADTPISSENSTTTESTPPAE